MLVKLLTTRAKLAIQDSLTFTLPKVKVRVNQGIVQGCVEKLPNGSTFQRFSGIPYAKPPVNELRFRSPQVLLKFDQDVVDCTRERDASFHKSGFLKKYIGSEDCLNLNVYAPSTATPTQKLPVMVFIHGGGLAFDSNSRDFYSPEYLLMEDVIVVTINYRLHAFGFSCLPSVGISGNAGLKDQQLALQWIHENISNFNGDPDNICLFGESAGAACVHLHAFNNKSNKLFKSAICQSNYALADWFFQKDGPGRTRHMAKVIGATGNSDEDILNALMQASPQQLCDSNVKCGESDMLRRNLPFVFKAVVEQESDDAFLTTNPLEMIKTQKLDVPMIFGINDGDGMTMGNYYRKKLPLFDKDYVRMVPLSLNTDPDSEEAKHIGKAIKQFYFGDKHINESTLSEFVDLMTDFHFTIPMLMSNELHARYQKNSKQFVFEFCYDGELNMFKKLLKMTDVKGACHFDELFYLFDAKMIGMEVAKDSPAWNMRKTMCKLWTNFAKYQNPTPDNDNPLSIKWNPIKSILDDTTTFDIDYLRIGDKFEMKSNLYSERVNFWRKLYEKHNSSFINPKF